MSELVDFRAVYLPFLLVSYAWESGSSLRVRESDMWPGFMELFISEGSRLPVSEDFRYALRFVEIEEELS